MLASDVFHPNDDGYAAIATAFVPHLLARLTQGT
jgi:lysophospholipase L1-like esterase